MHATACYPNWGSRDFFYAKLAICVKARSHCGGKMRYIHKNHFGKDIIAKLSLKSCVFERLVMQSEESVESDKFLLLHIQAVFRRISKVAIK